MVSHSVNTGEMIFSATAGSSPAAVGTAETESLLLSPGWAGWRGRDSASASECVGMHGRSLPLSLASCYWRHAAGREYDSLGGRLGGYRRTPTRRASETRTTSLGADSGRCSQCVCARFQPCSRRSCSRCCDNRGVGEGRGCGQAGQRLGGVGRKPSTLEGVLGARHGSGSGARAGPRPGHLHETARLMLFTSTMLIRSACEDRKLKRRRLMSLKLTARLYAAFNNASVCAKGCEVSALRTCPAWAGGCSVIGRRG